MPFLVAIFLILFGCRVSAEDIRLVSIGETWRYFKGYATPSAAGEWTDPNFDDSKWPVGLSSFSNSANFPETTVLPDYGPGYSSVYFRKKFNISSVANLRQLILRIDYDDAFVAYLNGVEVTRRGLSSDPGTPVTHDQRGAFHLRGYTETIDLSPGIAALRDGENVLAIHVLGSAQPDYTFCLVAELLNTFTRMPYIQNTTSNSIQIIYKTLSHLPSTIELGTSIGTAQKIVVSQSATNHVATLTGLLSGTEYFYRVSAGLPGNEAVTDWRSFRTFKPAGAVNFLVMGDSGWATPGQLAVARQLERPATDLLMHVGDLIYYSFSHFAADFRCFSVYSEFMRDTPIFVALGNHDSYVDRLAIHESFYLPTNSVTGTEHFYSFDHGDIHFVALWADLQAGASYAPGSPQYNWLEKDLAASTKRWKFIFFHHVYRSSAYHGNDNYNYNGLLDSVELQQSIGVLAARYGVQIIFNGHDHDFERFAPDNGIMSIVTGGGGAALYPMLNYQEGSVQFYPVFHFLDVSVTGDEAIIRAIDERGQLFDTFHLRRTFPERRPYLATTHTPVLERNVLFDPDGNIPGEQLDFPGEPIPGRAGKFSNTGRMFVNYDAENLYLGIDQAALNSAQDLYLFLESPRRPGLQAMHELSTAAAAAQASIVPGLACLDNLYFENFRPSVAVILGDEMADGFSPDFARPLAQTALGQGAFSLIPGTPAVPAQVIRQFNRSPQGSPIAYEQNASYIEVALPLEAIGIFPGDTFTAALITGLGAVEPASRTRPLDDGGVAYNVQRQEDKTTVEGVQIKLPALPLILRAVLQLDGRIQLSWPSQPGVRYVLQSAQDLAGTFVDSNHPAFPFTATGHYSTVLLDRNAAAHFYRLIRTE